ncbi:hypothetical protein D3C83_190510 [compost metagenome]
MEDLFDRLWRNTDDLDSELARRILGGEFTWLEEGVLDPSIPGPWIAAADHGATERANVHRLIE